MPARPGAGRPGPSKYTPELAERICELIAQGKSLATIEAIPGMPCADTIVNWTHTNEQFSDDVARARLRQADADAEKINELTERVSAGKIEPNAARVALLGYQWLARVRNPGRYGDRQQVDVSGKLTLEQIVAAAMKPKGENKG